ncbi:hypothetical protein FBY35_0449 [Streptomyces sp. SLBN-118]|uniref:DUF5825 family protein n=1 Tax=Streptomyces sp. SLBN-118 TaxID=2768454 RepID=UPI00114F262F|nr:DUF5825 family protein [Streptomyces sp. SLBN-118]TQK50138.1 hypothetical protein FBY35_0449 [Streptomyces sp. SLBN-118]
MNTALHAPGIRGESPLTVTAWRDYDPAVCALLGMSLGDHELSRPIAQESEHLWNLGARRVVMPHPIDLTRAATGTRAAAQHTVRSLSLVRDLTARAVLVEWQLRLEPDDDETWKLLSHLQPPQHVAGPLQGDEQLLTWRHTHYLCKCLWRQGPGFIQIRDRRWGDLRRFTSDEAHYHQAIALLDYGAEAASVPQDVLADFTEEHLVLTVGEFAWWLPYRVKRWIQEAMAI